MTVTSRAYKHQKRQNYQYGMIFILITGVLLGAPARGTCEGVPALIQLQSRAVQSAWAEIDNILRENRKLERQTAEPYLARAELWVVAGSHEDALRDYLTATDLLTKNQSNPAEQAGHLTRLRTALDQLLQQLRPHFPNAARDEFHSGTNAFQANRMADAAWSFEEACRLDSSVAMYHIYRALAYKRLGRDQDAEREVATAASLMRTPGSNVNGELRDLNSRLEFVQGPLRNWLNETLAQRPPATARARSGTPISK